VNNLQDVHADVVVLNYQSPGKRAMGTLQRQLVMDVIGTGIVLLAHIPASGPVDWRAVAWLGGTLLLKSALVTVDKYNRAWNEDEEMPVHTIQAPEEGR
jgi:hypothetical protein